MKTLWHILTIKIQRLVHLVDDVEELEEDRGEPACLVGCCLVVPMAESMAEREPLLLHEDTKAFQGSIVRIEKDLSYRCHLEWRENR